MTRYGRPVSIQQKPSTTGHSSRCKLVQISFARVLAALPSCPVWRVIWLFSKGQSYRYTCNPYGLPWAGPAAVVRFCASGCLPCFAFSALPGLFPGLLTCTRYICPAACLCAFSESLCGLPLLPFSIRAAACCSASALPSMAARFCLPKEVKAARLPAVVLLRCFAACFGPAGASRHTD